MAELVCDICGGKLLSDVSGEIFACDSCGTQYPKERIRKMYSEIVGRVQVENVVNIEKLVQRVELDIEDRDWASAKDLARQITDNDPENATGYYYGLLAEYEVQKEEALGSLDVYSIPLEQSKNYQRIMRFGDQAIKSRLTGYNESLLGRIHVENEKARALKDLQRQRCDKRFGEILKALSGVSTLEIQEMFLKCQLDKANSFLNSFERDIERADKRGEPGPGLGKIEEMLHLARADVSRIMAELEDLTRLRDAEPLEWERVWPKESWLSLGSNVYSAAPKNCVCTGRLGNGFAITRYIFDESSRANYLTSFFQNFIRVQLIPYLHKAMSPALGNCAFKWRLLDPNDLEDYDTAGKSGGQNIWWYAGHTTAGSSAPGEAFLHTAMFFRKDGLREKWIYNEETFGIKVQLIFGIKD